MSTVKIGRPRKDSYEINGLSIEMPARQPGVLFTMAGDEVIGVFPSKNMFATARKMLYTYGEDTASDIGSAIGSKIFSFKVAFKADAFDAAEMKHVMARIHKIGYADWLTAHEA